ncbi:MAG: ACR3 family arsenite efflux transporter [Schleiferiaceae bacterium]|nr:ACR3 family arsenite efflux transporter [Schleiferiaceae bacterium]
MTKAAPKSIGFFEKYLTLWVALCIIGGVVIGSFAGDSMEVVSKLNYAHVNIPIAILIWAMIFPMMAQIDFSSIKNAGKKPKGLILTLVINWLIKPFSMAFFAWLFFTQIYQAFISPDQALEYVAGAILLGVAPCTAMVFVWSYLTDGDPAYTLVQVSVNDLIILVAFVPLVALLFQITGVNQVVAVPYDTLLFSIFIFVVIPLVAGGIANRVLIKKHGEVWFNTQFLPKLKPISIVALLATLLLLFAFQGDIILQNPLIILLIAIPLTLQTYLIFFVTWGLGKYIKLPHAICAPAAMIGTSNFFELAVAVAIAVFGLTSPAALTTVVGVLVEVPIMLSLVALVNKWRY